MKRSFFVVMSLALVACFLLIACYGDKTVTLVMPTGLVEAPTGFENPPQTNGHESQADMDNDRSQFEQATSSQVEGPFFNNVQCSGCHFGPVSGGNSPNFERRISPDDPGNDPDDNIAPATLVHAASVPGFPQQTSPHGAITALRRSLSLFGDAFIEQIPDEVFQSIAEQNGGQIVTVKLLESPGTKAIGRFGWKDQQATLRSFAGDAACNEMGEENSLVNGINCNNKPPTNGIEDADNSTPARPEDIDNYQNFMQSLKAPPRGHSTPESKHGEALFKQIGCTYCHMATLYTKPFAPECMPNGCAVHPFSDYLLHDIGTGDGIQQGPAPANKLKTAPLWGTSRQDRFLHDGRAYDQLSAIEFHFNEADFARKRFNRLSKSDRKALLAFLGTL